MGTHWTVTIWDEVSSAVLVDVEKSITDQSKTFDETYSRFKKSSLVWSLTEKRGVITVPRDLVEMLRLYEKLCNLSGGKCTPLVGFALSDLGYDENYSLQEKQKIRSAPDFHQALTIIDDEHIELRDSVLLDVGALGKGFFVDKIAIFLQRQGLRRFLVDGSGDIFYQGTEPIRAGLEHPGDTSKAIGVLELSGGALCASASNRRQWGIHHHIIDPTSLISPDEILATWVLADQAAIADGLATCLFFTDPERYRKEFSFEYCILNKDYKVKRSTGFNAELFPHP